MNRDADIGVEAKDRADTDSGYTNVNIGNPCNVNGRITSIEVWANTNLTGFKVATFYIVKDGTFDRKYLTVRDYAFIGNVTAGAKRTFAVDLEVREGDMLGHYQETGEIEYDSDDEDGVYYLSGDGIPCYNTQFSKATADAASLYGTGIRVEPKTFAEIDGTLLVNQEGEFFGKTIDGELNVVRDIVGACLDTSQSLRMTITIDGEDVSDSIVGDITIAHNLNYISTFSLSLGDPKYSPLTDSHIAINSVVVITVFVNGQEIKMFTGLIDSTHTTYDGGYRLTITGRDYGKKLLDKTMTLISVQESAEKAYRGSMVKYLASQADITNVDVPIGDAVTIDHSFQDQNIWDMIQKEAAIEGWYIRHDENAIMHLKTRTIKTDTDDYPKADWDYGEDKFVQLGLETSDRGIINKLIIFSPSFSAGEVVTGWSEGDATIKVTASYVGFTKPSGFIFPQSQNYKFTISGSDGGKIKGLSFSVTGGAIKGGQSSNSVTVLRDCTGIFPSFSEAAFGVTITFQVKEETAGGNTWIDENLPNETTTSTITHTQVKATVTDANSIALYGERKPNNEGTLPFPLAETTAQCKRIGENIILDSHRFIKQPDFLVNFNPKLIVGNTVELTDKKIGYNSDRYFVEEVIHTISINSQTGAVKPRTRIGCVYYA